MFSAHNRNTVCSHFPLFEISSHGYGLLIFTVLHGMQTRSSDEKAVRPSVCLQSNVTKRKKDLSRFVYHTKDHLA